MKLSINIFMALMIVLAVFSCKKDPCKDNDSCVNGTCVAVDDEATCSCSAGYMGSVCDIKVNSLYLGTYSFVDTCNSTTGPLGSQTYSVVITEGTSPLMINISNIYDFGEVTNGTIGSDEYTFTIASQPIDANRGTITGTGSLSKSEPKITLDYSIDYGGGFVVSCQGILTRQ